MNSPDQTFNWAIKVLTFNFMLRLNDEMCVRAADEEASAFIDVLKRAHCRVIENLFFLLSLES